MTGPLSWNRNNGYWHSRTWTKHHQEEDRQMKNGLCLWGLTWGRIDQKMDAILDFSDQSDCRSNFGWGKWKALAPPSLPPLKCPWARPLIAAATVEQHRGQQMRLWLYWAASRCECVTVWSKERERFFWWTFPDKYRFKLQKHKNIPWWSKGEDI